MCVYLYVCTHTCARGDQKRMLAVHILKLALQIGYSFWELTCMLWMPKFLLENHLSSLKIIF